jgi:thiol peroxidase
MATVTLRGNPFHTSGELPAVGSAAPAFRLRTTALGVATLADHAGKNVVLNIFPSVDTPTCAASVRQFNARAAGLDNTVVLCVSADLPFAHKRFCGAEGIDKVASLSTLGSAFADDYGLRLTGGPLADLCARAVIVLNGAGSVVYTELVPEIAQEPNYDAALAAIG